MATKREDIVDAACESKQPGFLKAMETYLKRVNGLAMQSMMLRAGQTVTQRLVKHVAPAPTAQ